MRKIVKPLSNPAVGIVEDTLAHYELSQKEMAERLGVTPAFISAILRGRKKVSNELALRLEIAFNIPSGLLVKLQSDFDYQIAYHAKNELLKKEVTQFTPAFS